MKFSSTNAYDEKHHFFASSVATWLARDDLDVIIKAMKREGYPFNIWMIQGDVDRPYGINNYAPQVDDAVWIGFYSK
jgi:hypothetical protein